MRVSYEIEQFLGKWVVTRYVRTDSSFIVDKVVVEDCYQEIAAFAIAVEKLRYHLHDEMEG